MQHLNIPPSSPVSPLDNIPSRVAGVVAGDTIQLVSGHYGVVDLSGVHRLAKGPMTVKGNPLAKVDHVIVECDHVRTAGFGDTPVYRAKDTTCR